MRVKHPTIPAHLNTTLRLSLVLRAMEANPTVDASQYRDAAIALAGELKSLRMDSHLQALLAAFQPTADIYENVNYEHAGLCLCALDIACNAEKLAREFLKKLGRAS